MVEAKQSLQKLLAGLGEASQFVSAGQLSAILPGLEVKGIGLIGVPVTPTDAKRIIGKASQAPYGRGAATIVDTDVRRVWQLEPSQFTLRNAAWRETLAGVVDAVKHDLTIRGQVNAELYKLLVYEKGSFFKPHRDTEKVPGMFGTLIVCLPSPHEGGTLILQHDGQTKNIDFGGKDSEFQTRYVAFYADCQHEIAPVKSGYRLCLVYNLASGGKKQPKAPHNAAAVEEAAQLLKELFSETSEPLNKLAIPFTHQYTEAGLDSIAIDAEADNLGEDRKGKTSERELDDDEREALTLLRLGGKRTGIVASIVRILSVIGASKHLTNFLAHVLADNRHYDLRAVLIPDVRVLYTQTIPTTAGRRAASRLLQHCLMELRAATAHPIEPPKDWKREAKLGCRCEDCVALSRFLRDPAERVGRFPLNKQRRRHLHEQIDKHRCDIQHVTETSDNRTARRYTIRHAGPCASGRTANDYAS